MRTRSHHAHIAFQYIDKLWCLIDVCTAKHIAPPCLSRVVFCSLESIALFVDLHAAELIHNKLFAIDAASFLTKEHRTRHSEFGDSSHYQEQPWKYCHQEHQRHYDVESALYESVGCGLQRVLEKIHIWYRPYHIEVHTLMQVIIHARHAIVVHKIILAMLYYALHQIVTIVGFDAAIHFLNSLMASEIVDCVVNTTQVFQSGKSILYIVVEITQHIESSRFVV